ncbi:MAG TPA: hypothetical protein VMF06_05650 [Candidatus Limnocylindria bacterium]|nr:hypothetical protein [Candidatus Limnocylindria bacterium]
MALLSGIFLTADALTFERREGTLGLLFLTDLRGFDVVIGKLASAGLSSFFGLISLFPVFAISWLWGGVSRPEFWCTCLALLITLLFSLSVGLAVSSTRSTNASRAMFTTGVILALFTLVLPWLASQVAKSSSWAPWATVLRANPWSCIFFASNTDTAAGMARFLWTAGGLSVCSVVALGCASWILPVSWRIGYSGGDSRTLALAHHRSGTFSKPLLDGNPLASLVEASQRKKCVVWGMAILVTLPAWLEWPLPGICGLGVDIEVFLIVLLTLGSLGFILMVAWEATGFFCEALRSGWLAILLTTPLADREVLRGQWVAMRRLFLLPIAWIFVTLWQILLRYGGLAGWDSCLLLGAIQGVLVVHFLTAAWAGASCALAGRRRPVAFLKTIGILILPQLSLVYPILEPLVMMAVLFYIREDTANGIRYRIEESLSGQSDESTRAVSGAPSSSSPAGFRIRAD